ncbi:MAG: hypothetical protein KC636_07275, partial [Myxococcales bacterium]|nr:hypothetical protein [Myxococcales bacterium]
MPVVIAGAGLVGAAVAFLLPQLPWVGPAVAATVGVLGGWAAWSIEQQALQLRMRQDDAFQALKEAETDRKRFEHRLTEAGGHLQARTGELEAAKDRVQELSSRLQAAESELQRARARVAEVEGQLRAAQTAASPAGDPHQLTRLQLELDRERDASRRAREQLQEQLGVVQRSLEEVSRERDKSVKAVDELRVMVARYEEGPDRDTQTLLEELTEGFGRSAASMEEAFQALSGMNQGLKGIADNVEQLASNAEESASSILEMAAANDEVAESMFNLASSVQETASAIEEMTYSVREVAKSIEALSGTAEETSAAMNEMDISIQQVENNANETAQLSEEVVWAAEGGVDAINQTIEVINLIKTYSGDGVAVIGRLGESISEIGKILSVIDDVSEQTNLLALNAAIIAAQ